MAADSAATKRDLATNEITEIVPNFRKIYHISKTNFGISCWGLGTIQEKSVLDFLAEFEESSVEKTDSLDQVAGKLSDCLRNITPNIHERMGLHLAGYLRKEDENVPQLRHIFHERWHRDGEFVCENCHIESLSEKERIEFPSYIPYPPLFNGDNAIANCLVNFIPYMTQGRQRIEPASLTLEECIELAELVVGTSIQRLNYFVDSEFRKIPKTVGGKVLIAKITPTEGFEWVKDELGDN
jgi:hypothetical protein